MKRNKLIFKFLKIDYNAIIYKKEQDNNIYIIINETLSKIKKNKIIRILGKLKKIKKSLGFLFIL